MTIHTSGAKGSRLIRAARFISVAALLTLSGACKNSTGIPPAASSATPTATAPPVSITAAPSATVAQPPDSWSWPCRGVTARTNPPSEIFTDFAGEIKKIAGDIQFTPEYNYKTFFFVPPVIVKDQSRNYLPREQGSIARDILNAGKTTKVIFFAEDNAEKQALAALLKDKIVPGQHFKTGRIKILIVGKGEIQGLVSFFAQDYGENGGSNFVFGSYLRRPRKLPFSKKANLSQLRPYGVRRILTLPASLSGGNLVKAIANDGKKLVIIGSDLIYYTQNMYYLRYQHLGKSFCLPAQEIKDIYQLAFGADDVLILGEEGGQPGEIPHIDQAVFFPKDGVAVMIEPKDAPRPLPAERVTAINKMLQIFEKQLQKSGFSIIKIPTTYDHIAKGQSYANAMAISTDKGPHVIIPSFGDDAIESAIKEKLEREHFTVAFIKNTTYGSQGNTHCLTGSLGK